MNLVINDFLQKIYDIVSVYLLPVIGIAAALMLFRYLFTKEKRGIISFFLWVSFTGLIIGETIIRRLGTVKETTDILGFSELLQDPWFIVAAVENVIMFLPYGFLFALAFRMGKVPFLKCILITLLLCIGIEVTQFVLVIGEAEVLDVLCNLCGTLIGYGVGKIFVVLGKRIGKRTGKYRI